MTIVDSPPSAFPLSQPMKHRYYVIQSLGYALASKKSTLEKYIALKSFVTIGSWFEMNFQSCFPTIDKLKT